MEECATITAITKAFPYSHENKTVTAQRKQSPLKLRHAITARNSQSAALEYMNRDFDSTSKNGKPNTVAINQGAMSKILCGAKSRDNLQVGHSPSKIRF